MSTTLQTLPIRTRLGWLPFAIAIVIALSVGATAGSVITRTVVTRSHPVASATGWDAQKLQTMAGRELAVAVRGGTNPWDPQKLRAMEGRQRFEAIRLQGTPR
ncbi:MAG: hypothetical protein E6J13_16035 [Chloroflexi bacterium]|nr:MAG: hypothetical protein E6J13_16035 [Chloroflexota bacterium]